MFHPRTGQCSHTSHSHPLGPNSKAHSSGFGTGMLAGAAAATAFILGRRLASARKVSRGHPLKHQVLDAASHVMQRKYPLEAMSTYLNGFHHYADDMGRQVEACHFCIHLEHDLHQCVIFDSNRSDARLIGIEYIISAERFAQLPEEEKPLWHSHHYEVKSGILVAPGIPELAERSYFEDLVTTYGKTFHTWQIDRDDFPYGIPQLMMAFTRDGQINEELVARRDARLGISTQARGQRRSGIEMPEVSPKANGGESPADSDSHQPSRERLD